eukprot:1749087-Pyramimonas_sp.AAC.1
MLTEAHVAEHWPVTQASQVPGQDSMQQNGHVRLRARPWRTLRAWSHAPFETIARRVAGRRAVHSGP